MPLYEYQCKKCKHKFERIQKFSDPLVKKCPECGGPVEQTISAPAVQFKGSGFYATDYAAKKPSGGGDSHEKEEKTHETKEKSEDKAKKSEAKKLSSK